MAQHTAASLVDQVHAGNPKPDWSRVTAGGPAPVAAKRPKWAGTRGTGRAGVGASVNISAGKTSAKLPDAVSTAGLGGIPHAGGIVRAIGGTAVAIGRSLNPAHPKRALTTLEHSAGQAKDMAAGLGGLAALAGNTALLPIHAATEGTRAVKELGGAYENVGKGIVQHVSHDYGPLFRGESGALGERTKQLEKEGALAAVADLASLGGGESALLGAGARRAVASGAEEGGLVARAAKATTERPALRTGVHATKEQTVHKGLVGGAATRVIDKAREAQQAARVREATTGEVGKVRAAAKLPARGLPAHRVDLAPSEVAPLSDKLAAAAVRRRVAAGHADAQASASRISKRLVVGKHGAKAGPTAGATLRSATRGLSEEQAQAAKYAAQLGIRDSQAGLKAVVRRAEQVSEHVEGVRAAGAAQGAGLEPGVLQELPALHALAAKPELFDDPAVIHAANTIRDVGREVIKGHGLTLDSSRAVAADLQARHLGEAPRSIPDRQALRSELAIAQRAEAKAREEVRHAQGRAEIVSRNIGGARAERAAAARRKPVFASYNNDDYIYAKLVLAAAEKRVADIRDRARAPVEPAGVFATRVEAAAAKHGLEPGGYLPSRYNTVDGQVATGALARPGAHGLGSKHREGTVFDMGAEVGGHEAIRNAELAHQTRLLKYERAGAVSDTLEREGHAFSSREEAESYIRAHNIAPDKVALLGPETHGGVVRSSARTAGLYNTSPAAAAKDLGDAFAPTGATYVVPIHVKDELTALSRPPGKLGKSLDKAKVVTTVSLLGLNPSWIQFQTIADSLVAGAAGVTPADIVRAYRIRAQLTDAGRDTLDLLSGNSGVSDILKSSDALTGSAAILHANPVYRKFLEGKRPLTALIRADAARTGLVRDAAILKRLAKSQRTADIDAGIRASRPVQDKLTSALASAKPDELEKALSGPLAADAAAHTIKIMGDFTHYTALERNVLRRAVPFYGFLRYSVRLALYTLPVDHPAIGLLLAELGNASAQEQKSILGGDELPYGLGALYNKDGTRKTDFSRSNPFGNSVFSMAGFGQGVTGLMPPIAVPILDAAYGSSAFRGNKAYTFGGNPKPVDPSALTGAQRASIWLSESLGLLPPVRILGNVLRGGAKSSGDNYGLLGSHKLPYDEPEGSLAQRAQAQFLPLTASSQPTQDKVIAAGIRARKLKASRPAGYGGGRPVSPDSLIDRLGGGSTADQRAIDAIGG